MLLAIDIGNSSISLGLFELTSAADRPTPVMTAKLASAVGRTADEYAVIIRGLLADKGHEGRVTRPIRAAVMGSVVPQLTHTLESAIQKLEGSTPIPVTHIGGGVRTGISLRVDDPSALGADIVTNAAAAVRLYGAPVIFLDFGTATVCGAVNMARELTGVSIAPGLTTALEGLRAATAQLPYMELKAPEAALGKNTPAAIRSGVVLGTACMVDGLIQRIRTEMKLPKGAALPIVATGGLAELVLPSCTHEITYEPDLTLMGLYYIHQATLEREARKNK